MRRTRSWRAALLLGALAAPAGAQSFNSGATGTSSAEFLRLGVSARAAALGEAFSAVVDDASSLFYNPAGMAAVTKNALSFTHSPYLADTSCDYGGYVRKLQQGNAWGVGVQYFGAGDIQQTDAAGQDVAVVRPYGLAVTGAYAQPVWTGEGVPDFMRGGSIGLSMKYVRQQLVRSAWTVGFGAGFQSRFFEDGRLRFAAALDNVGGRLRFDQESDPLPVTLRAGALWKAAPDIAWSFEALFPRDAPPAAAVGAEYDQGWFALRAGLNTTTLGEVAGFSGVTAGLGFRQEGWSVDYALAPFGVLGLAHRISLSVRFPASLDYWAPKRTSDFF